MEATTNEVIEVVDAEVTTAEPEKPTPSEPATQPENLGIFEADDETEASIFNPPPDEIPAADPAADKPAGETTPPQQDAFNKALAEIIVGGCDSLYLLLLTKFVMREVSFNKEDYLPNKATNLALIGAWADVLAYYNVSSQIHPVGRLVILMVTAYSSSFAKAKLDMAAQKAALQKQENQPAPATIIQHPSSHQDAAVKNEAEVIEIKTKPRGRGADKVKRKPKTPIN
jgi:hypothetical protein